MLTLKMFLLSGKPGLAQQVPSIYIVQPPCLRQSWPHVASLQLDFGSGSLLILTQGCLEGQGEQGART